MTFWGYQVIHLPFASRKPNKSTQQICAADTQRDFTLLLLTTAFQFPILFRTKMLKHILIITAFSVILTRHHWWQTPSFSP